MAKRCSQLGVPLGAEREPAVDGPLAGLRPLHSFPGQCSGDEVKEDRLRFRHVPVICHHTVYRMRRGEMCFQQLDRISIGKKSSTTNHGESATATASLNMRLYKGMLNMVGNSHKIAFQGVHMIMGGNKLRPWRKDDTRESVTVFSVASHQKNYPRCLQLA